MVPFCVRASVSGAIAVSTCTEVPAPIATACVIALVVFNLIALLKGGVAHRNKRPPANVKAT